MKKLAIVLALVFAGSAYAAPSAGIVHPAKGQFVEFTSAQLICRLTTTSDYGATVLCLRNSGKGNMGLFITKTRVFITADKPFRVVYDGRFN